VPYGLFTKKLLNQIFASQLSAVGLKKLETHASHNIKKSGHGELLELRLLEKSA
jgi:hypothetical protein